MIMAAVNFSRIAKDIFILGAILSLIACGGGGSGSSKGEEAKGSSVIFTVTGTTRLNFYAESIHAELPANVAVAGKISKSLTNLYIVVDPTSEKQLVRQVTFVPISEDTGALSFSPEFPLNVGRGKYSQTVSVKLCEDANCLKELKGSPIKIDIQYVVDPSDLFTLTVANTEGGTVTQSKDTFQCGESHCQKEIYGWAGEVLEFTAHAKPGYKFSHWDGGCTGSESCRLPFAVNGNASIKANFSPRSAEQDVCSNASLPQGAHEGALNLGSATAFVPLCKGLVLASYENRVDLIDIFNANMLVKSFALDFKPFKLKVDPANNLLYVSHYGADYLSRININSGGISKIHIPRVVTSYGSPSEEMLLVADKGYVLATASTSYAQSALWIIDGVSAMRVKRLDNNIMMYLGYPEVDFLAQSKLISVLQNELTTYSFDSNLLTVTPITMWPASTNPLNFPLAISPDGIHMAYIGDGRFEGSTMQHMLAKDGTLVGTWHSNSDSNWLFAKFSPQNNYIGIMNESDFSIDVYSVNASEHMTHFSGKPASCSVSRTSQAVAFSSDESTFFGMRVCDYIDTDTILSWSKFK